MEQQTPHRMHMVDVMVMATGRGDFLLVKHSVSYVPLKAY
jgi:hypothetical protein